MTNAPGRLIGTYQDAGGVTWGVQVFGDYGDPAQIPDPIDVVVDLDDLTYSGTASCVVLLDQPTNTKFSRATYSEILGDDRKETAAAFWARANTFFESTGVTVTAVKTDNGARATAHATSHKPSAASCTFGRAPIGAKQTGRPNASTAPSPPDGAYLSDGA